VVRAVVDRVVVVAQSTYGAPQRVTVGIEECHVVEAGVRRRGRRPARALPSVQTDVVVVVARGQEGGVEPDLTTIDVHAEAERVAIERDSAVEIRDVEVDVADADGGMYGLGLHAGQSGAPQWAGHRCIHLTETRKLRGSRS